MESITLPSWITPEGQAVVWCPHKEGLVVHLNTADTKTIYAKENPRKFFGTQVLRSFQRPEIKYYFSDGQSIRELTPEEYVRSWSSFGVEVV